MNRIAATLLLLSLAPGAQAASCQIAATDLAFGQYRFNSDVDVLSTVTISIENCVPDAEGVEVSYSIAISAGNSADFADRAMGGFGGALHYNIYVDPGHTLVWGDGGAGTVDVSGSFTVPIETSASHTGYARIPAGQTDLSPGPYADQLTVLISY
jgi:spore coat protein U-like protein